MPRLLRARPTQACPSLPNQLRRWLTWSPLRPRRLPPTASPPSLSSRADALQRPWLQQPVRQRLRLTCQCLAPRWRCLPCWPCRQASLPTRRPAPRRALTTAPTPMLKPAPPGQTKPPVQPKVVQPKIQPKATTPAAASATAGVAAVVVPTAPHATVKPPLKPVRAPALLAQPVTTRTETGTGTTMSPVIPPPPPPSPAPRRWTPLTPSPPCCRATTTPSPPTQPPAPSPSAACWPPNPTHPSCTRCWRKPASAHAATWKS